MAITYGTLAQEIDGKVNYIYPKTDAKIVEYKDSKSVKDELDLLNNEIERIDARVTNISDNIKIETGGLNIEELIDLRTPNYNLVPEDTQYESAGNAVRGQFQEVIKLINNKVTAEYVDTAIENTIGLILQSDY